MAYFQPTDVCKTCVAAAKRKSKALWKIYSKLGIIIGMNLSLPSSLWRKLTMKYVEGDPLMSCTGCKKSSHRKKNAFSACKFEKYANNVFSILFGFMSGKWGKALQSGKGFSSASMEIIILSSFVFRLHPARFRWNFCFIASIKL